MKVICVDDEAIVLEEIKEILEKQPDVSEVTEFLSAQKALSWVKTNAPDVAFLDISMGQMDGLALAKHIRELHNDCSIVFVTGYSEFAVDAFALHADGYLMKPASVDDVRRELDHIQSKHPLSPPKCEKLIRVQCFGNFEIFASGAPLRFERNKTKELMAYLVDRQGAGATIGELIAVLWGDAPDTLSIRSNLRNIIHDLKSTLSRAGAENVLIKGRDTISVDCSAIECDLYDFLRRMPYAVNRYRGEYMSQYPWAEITLAGLFSN